MLLLFRSLLVWPVPLLVPPGLIHSDKSHFDPEEAEPGDS